MITNVQIQAFIDCVKKNYDLITKFNLLPIENRNLDHLVFKMLLYTLRDSFDEMEVLHGSFQFPKEIDEYAFFNKMLKNSKHLSNVANKVSIGEITISQLYEQMDLYCKDMTKFYTAYSLILKNK